MAGNGSEQDASDVTAALEAMKQAAEELAKTASSQPTSVPTPTAELPTTASRDEETQRYYEHLRQRGQLSDVDESTDLTTLAPEITHVRYPDGRIRRVGYS